MKKYKLTSTIIFGITSGLLLISGGGSLPIVNAQIFAQNNQQNTRTILYVNPQQGLDYEDAGNTLERPFRSISYALK